MAEAVPETVGYLLLTVTGLLSARLVVPSPPPLVPMLPPAILIDGVLLSADNQVPVRGPPVLG